MAITLMGPVLDIRFQSFVGKQSYSCGVWPDPRRARADDQWRKVAQRSVTV